LPRVESLDERFQTIDQAESQPGHWSDDDHEPEYRNQGCRKPAPASEQGRQPIENRIKRDGQHDAPDDDRYERSYENEGPVGEEADKSEVNRQFEESRVELTIIERFCAHRPDMFAHAWRPEYHPVH